MVERGSVGRETGPPNAPLPPQCEGGEDEREVVLNMMRDSDSYR